MGNAVFGQGDQADRLFAGDVAESLKHPRLRQPVAAVIGNLDADQLAVLSVGFSAGPDRQFPAPAGDRHDARLPVLRAKNAQQSGRRLRQHLDNPGKEAAVCAVWQQAGEHPVADAGRPAAARLAAGLNGNDNRRRVAPFSVPFQRHGNKIALVIDAFDAQNGDRWQVAGPSQSAAATIDLAVLGHLPQQPF